MNLTMSLVELKSAAYDCLAVIEQKQYELRQINAAIVEASKKPVEPIKEEKKD